MRGVVSHHSRGARAAAMCVLAGALAVAAIAPARAQMESREGITLQNEILELRRDLQQLSQQVNAAGSNLGARQAPPTAYSGTGGGNGDLVAQLLDRVSSLEDQVRRLQGRVDEIDNARQRQYDDLSKQIGDLKFSMRAGGGAPSTLAPPSSPDFSGAPDTAPSNVPPAPPPPAAPKRTAELALQEANAALGRRDYAAAETAAREAIALPRGPRTADAQFTLGQALSAQGKYAPAAVAYDDAFKRNPQGGHAQDSLLGLAISLNALNAKKESCEALDQLRASFPAPKAELRDTIASARTRAGCH